MKKILAHKLCHIMGWNVSEAWAIQNRSLTQDKLSAIVHKLSGGYCGQGQKEGNSGSEGKKDQESSKESQGSGEGS